MGVILLATLVKLCYCLTTTLDNTNVAMDIINSNTTTDNRDIINWLATVVIVLLCFCTFVYQNGVVRFFKFLFEKILFISIHEHASLFIRSCNLRHTVDNWRFVCQNFKSYITIRKAHI